MNVPLGAFGPDSPQFQSAVAAAFDSAEEKKASDICQNGTDGIGHIAGTVWERGTILDGCWAFAMWVGGGCRAQVLLSGNISEYFSALPIAVGARVRLRTKGLILEDCPPRALTLKKRFVWREGVVIHVHHAKSGRELFCNTFLAVPPVDTPIVEPILPIIGTNASPSSLPTPPEERKRTPLPEAGTSDRADYPSNVTPTNDQGGTAPTLPVSDNIVINPPEPLCPPVLFSAPTATSETPTFMEAIPDSQNPQSLPSPPEMKANQQAEERSSAQANAHFTDDSSTPHQPPLSRLSHDREVVAALTHGVDGLPSNASPVSLESAAKSKRKRRAVAEPPAANAAEQTARKKLRRQHHRREKQNNSKHAAALASKPDTREESVDVHDDQYYWSNAEREIPDDLLDAITEQPMFSRTDAVASPSASVPAAPSSRSKTPEHASQIIQDENDPVASRQEGCTTSFGAAYTPLIKFEGQGMKCIMGVINSITPPTQTKSGEYMARFSLYDPTNFATSGLSVTLFEKSTKALPQPEIGDVLLLQDIAVDTFAASCAVGASFKGWQWAAFNVRTGQLHSAPQDTCSLRYFKPEKSELHRCLRLGDWWRDVSSEAVSLGIEPSMQLSTRRTRQHKLFLEAQIQEYFDCTVEIVHGFQNNNSVHNVYTLFVTDYTRHPSAPTSQGSWCPPKLAEIVMPVELWETATALGPNMQVGGYYSIRNIKLKLSGGGFLEGKMVEGEKITKLDEDQLENEPHLVALLKRKKEWEAIANTTGGIHEFPHQLIEAAEENRHFNCTVEVVYISVKEDYLYLYVTDYTARPDLVPISAAIASEALDGRIARISLNDAQVDIAKNLEIGDFITIRNLRLHASGGGSQLCGRLGGDQRLITKLNPKATGNAELRALLRRKEEFEAVQTKLKRGKKGGRAARQAEAAAKERQPSTSTSTSTSTSPVKNGKAVAQRQSYKSLSDVKGSDTCPGVFRVRARVVDFFPDDLRDCTFLRCTSCDETIPPTRRRCTKCDDAMEDETFVRAFFQLYFRIADEEGTTLDVSVSDDRCSVLEDLVPDDVHEDDAAFSVLLARVKPLLGGILDVSDGEARRRPVAEDDQAADAPLLDLTLGSWLPEGEPDTAESRAYIVLKHSVCEAHV